MKKFNGIKLGKVLLLIILIGILNCVGLFLYTKGAFVSVAYDIPVATLSAQLSKYINYDEEWGKGTIIQYNVKSGIEYGNSQEYSPIKNTYITLELPEIDGNYPEEVTVIPISTKATNGKESNIEGNYTYDSVNGILYIQATNEDENGNAIYTENDANANDEYEVILRYGENVYNADNVERSIVLKGTATETLYREDNSSTYTEKTFTDSVNENIGQLLSITSDIEEIYNGYIKSNIINGTTYGTQFKQTDEIMVSQKEAQQKIYIVHNNTFIRNYSNGDGEEVTIELGNNQNLTIKSSKFIKEEITKLLGEEVTIQIYDLNGNLLAEINKDTEFSDDGTLTLTYENEPEGIIVKTSDILQEGILHIENTKEIKYTMQDLDNTKVKTTNYLIGIEEDVTPIEETAEDGSIIQTEEITEEQTSILRNENVVEIKDATTTINFDANVQELTNERQNEVTFEVSLQANSFKDNMFKNPTIRIELPSQVEKVILGSCSLVFGNGLELQNTYLETNENGNIVIVADIIGEQTQYNDNTLGLNTNITIPATIILKKDVSNSKENINLTYTNEYTLTGETEVGSSTKEINIVSYTTEETVSATSLSSSVYSTSMLSTEDTDGLQLEVEPVRGDVTLSEGDTVYEGEYIKYNIKVTNTSDVTIDNVKVVGTIPDGTTYGELEADYNAGGKYEYNFDESITFKEIEIGTLEAGESVTEFYEVQVNDLPEGEEEKQITSTIKAYVENDEFSSYEQTNIVQNAESKVFLSIVADYAQSKYTYVLSIIGDSDVDLKIAFTKYYSIEYICEEDSDSFEYEIGENGTTISEDNVLSIYNLKPGDYYIGGYFDETAIVQDIETQDSEVVFTAVATITVGNSEYKSNENRLIYKYYSAEITMTSENEGEEVRYGEEINYEITITNTGGRNDSTPDSTSQGETSIYINVTDFLPENVTAVEMTYENYVATEEYDSEGDIIKNITYDKEIVTEDISGIQTNIETGEKLPNIDLYLRIPHGESAVIYVKTTAGYVYEETKVENNATLKGEYLKTKISNTVTHTILPFSYDDSEEIENPETPSVADDTSGTENSDTSVGGNEEKYTISGLAWVDSNEDGQRQSTEQLLSGVSVLLVDTNNTNDIAKETQTSSNGEYKFTDLSQGNYLVIFRYDTTSYSITEYQKNGVSTTENSDAISQQITLNGSQITAGVTDIITLNSSATNIDIGLIENKVCDFRLDKYITKVTVKTSSGTKEYSYDNESLAKVEIRAKEIEGATVVIEYKIVITNEGEISGTVGQVVDYFPEGLTFSSELNSNWATMNNNEIINTSIGNQSIQPGESVELTLIATKTMTESSTGTFSNAAEIAQISNSQGTSDIDSTPYNREQGEDDYSSADIIISVSTGALILYISIVIAALTILGTGIYLIKRFNILKIGKITLFGCLVVAVLLLGNEETLAATAPSKADWDFGGYFPGKRQGTWFNSSNPDIGTGVCISAGLPIAGVGYITGVKNENGYTEMWGHWSVTYSRNGYTNSYAHHTDTEQDDVSINLSGNTDEYINMNRVGNTYVYGPFQVNLTNDDGENLSNVGYTIEVYDNDGNLYNGGYYTCDANGNQITIQGTGTFYLTFGEGYIPTNGVSRVRATVSRTGTKIVTTYYKAQAVYTYSSAYQDVRTDEEFDYDSETKTTPLSNSKSIEWTYINTCLEILKQDADNSSIYLSDVTINVSNDSVGYNETFVTDGSGRIFIENLRPGTYTITELDNPNYGYYTTNVWIGDNQYGPTTYYLGSGVEETYELKNQKQTGNLKILKKDADSDVVLEGFEFKIKTGSDNLDGQNGMYIVVNGQSTITGSVVVNEITYTDNIDAATTFITDASGTIEITNLLIGTYVIEEVGVGENYYGYEVDDDYIMWEVSDGSEGQGNETTVYVNRQSSDDTRENGATAEFCDTANIYNRKKYVKISGYVWEDIAGGKDSEYDNLYYGETYSDADGNLYDGLDELLGGVVVRLKDLNTGEVVTQIDGSAFETYTSESDGSYLFEDVLIGGFDKGDGNGTNWGLSTYYIEFEYDGLTYTTVKDFSELGYSKVSAPENSSKAQENASERQELDNKYEEITGKPTLDESRNGTGTEAYGYVRSEQAELVYDLESDSEAIATYNDEKSDIYDFNKVTADTQSTGYNVLGNDGDLTSDDMREGSVANGVETVQSIREEGITELAKRNLGLREREQVDLSVAMDLAKVEVLVDEYKNTYVYGTMDDATDMESYRLSVKAQTIQGYTRKMYRSDIVYNIEQANDTTQVYMTYKIAINNNSSTLSAEVTELVTYYDSRYEIVAIGATDDLENDSYSTAVSNSGKYGSTYYETISETESYTSSYIENPVGIIEAGQTGTIYIKYRLSNEAVISILTGDITLNNVIEINSFTTYYGDRTYYHTGDGAKGGELYASVDIDSAPGDVDLLTSSGELYRETYEDDTAISPSITMSLTEEERTISGTVFEDDAIFEENDSDDEVHTGQTRLGDGIYNTDEGVVGGVKVDLLMYGDEGTASEFDDSKIATLYVYEQNSGESAGVLGIYTRDDTVYTAYTKSGTVTTGEDGTYSFSGIIPGKYILRYTYADGNVVYKQVDGESQETTIDVDYYKSTIITSEAISTALNNNSISGDGTTADADNAIDYEGSSYNSEKWYFIQEENRYSDAVDSNEIILRDTTKSNNTVDNTAKEYTINNSNYNSESGKYDSEITSKEAFSGVINVQVEFSEDDQAVGGTETTTEMLIKNSDGTWRYITDIQCEYPNVDFGIVQRAKLKYEVLKEVDNVKITLANGQILIDGDPKDGLSYVVYLPGATRLRSTTTRIEMDDELLYGSTLEITYRIAVINESEYNYLTEDFYRYGTPGEYNNLEKMTVSKLIDYVDNDLVYNEKEEDNNNGIWLLEEYVQTYNETNGTNYSVEEFLETYLDATVNNEEKLINDLITTILILDSQKELVSISAEGYKDLQKQKEEYGYYDLDWLEENYSDCMESWEYATSKVLATSDELEFTNDIEAIEIITTNPVPEEDTIPGNYDPIVETTTIGELNDSDEVDNYNSVLVITDPTGEDRSYTVYIIGVIVLIILATGIIIIKKKVL